MIFTCLLASSTDDKLSEIREICLYYETETDEEFIGVVQILWKVESYKVNVFHDSVCFSRNRWMRFAVLRQGIQYTPVHQHNSVSLQVPLVLLCEVRHLQREDWAVHVQVEPNPLCCFYISEMSVHINKSINQIFFFMIWINASKCRAGRV